jgi:hypothetical protein
VIVLLIIILWFACGFLSLYLLRRDNLPPVYRVLLVMEGLLGLIFILIFKGGKG